ncbi:MAG: hypothetical protein IE883_06140 [Epsilonproteobacteria bacterium]|nr:hypothetical protein [Campylobacterota bacterium]
MNWKFFFSGVLVIAVGLGFWFLDGWLSVRALAVADGERYALEAEGWEILLSGWPLAAVAIAPGLVIGFFFGLALIGFAEDADKADLKKRLERAQEQAKTADARATERARNQLQNEIMHAQQQQRAAQMAQEMSEAKELEANAMIARAQQQIEQAQKDVKHAQIEASRAKRKAENRKHAMLRHKEKAERLMH